MLILTLLTNLCLFGLTPAPVAESPLLIGPPTVYAAPVDAPDPTSTTMDVEIKGEETGLTMEFDEDGTWELTNEEGIRIGWGSYIFDEKEGTIHYENHSEDGGGNQTGTYTWIESECKWHRTEASHPDAPPVALNPNQH